MTILISVIIGSYNRYDQLIRCLRSVHEQILPRFHELEIIVVNDGSTDPRYYTHLAQHEKQEYQCGGITIIHLAKNTRDMLGYVSAGFVRNCGIRISRGKWLSFCDDDDYWLPGKLAKQLKYRASVTDAYRYTENGHTQLYSGHYMAYYRSLRPFDFNNGFPDRISRDMIYVHNFTIFSSLVIHRDVMLSVGVFNEIHPFREFYEDWDYMKRICDHEGIITYIDEPLVYYTVSSTTPSSTIQQRQNDALVV